MNATEQAVEKATRIMSMYGDKVCKGYRWVDERSFDTQNKYSLSESARNNQEKIVDLLEEYNSTNPDKKIMVDSKEYREIERVLSGFSSGSIEMEAYHTPYLSYCLKLCKGVSEDSYIDEYRNVFMQACRSYIDCPEKKLQKRYQKELIEESLIPKDHIEKILAIDESRLEKIEFCDKKLEEIKDEKRKELIDNLRNKSLGIFNKEKKKLIPKSEPDKKVDHSGLSLEGKQHGFAILVLGAAVGVFFTLIFGG